SWPDPLDHSSVASALDRLADEAAALVGGDDADAGDVEVERLVDCRYTRQSHELTVPSPDALPAEHRPRDAATTPGAPVAVVALRVRARRPALLTPARLPDVSRRAVRGPDVVAEPDCTVWVPDGWQADPGPLGAWVVHR